MRFILDEMMDTKEPQRKEPGVLKTVEDLFERLLWSSRLLMIVGVIFSLLMALGAFLMATADALLMLKHLAAYTDTSLAADGRADVRGQTITLIVKAIDGYLIAAILLVFALGLYELFINKIDAARNSEAAPRLLQIKSLDDLKERIAGLLLLVLVIEFFHKALRLQYETMSDLLMLAAGILLISAAFYLSNLRGARKQQVAEAQTTAANAKDPL